jgi:hypothetical protein
MISPRKNLHLQLKDSDSLSTLKPSVPASTNSKPHHRRFFSQTETEFPELAKTSVGSIQLPRLARADSSQQLTYHETLTRLRESMKTSRPNMLQYLKQTAKSPTSKHHSPLFASFKRNLIEPSQAEAKPHRRTSSLSLQEPERQLTIYSKFNKKTRAVVVKQPSIKARLQAEKATQQEQQVHIHRVLDAAMHMFD